MPVQVSYIDYGNYRYKVGDTIRILNGPFANNPSGLWA